MRAIWYRGYESHGQWGLWAMGTQGAMGYRGIGHMAMRPIGAKDTGVWGT